ncbi:unnamed protein product, partial [marine sediment metagenome]
IDPIVAPTSGLRIQILDQIEKKGKKKLLLTNRKLFLFLRVFKAISQQYIEMKKGKNLKILIVTDNRPTKSILLQYCSQIFAYDGYEIYSALHNILANDYHKKIINVRTIPSDLRGDNTSFINILTGVGYKHLGVIFYFLLGIGVDKSKVDKAILYFEDEDNNLIQINTAEPLKRILFEYIQKNDLFEEEFLIVMWE